MSDKVIFHFDAEEISETDAEFHTITIALDEPMVNSLERYQSFAVAEGVTISKAIKAEVDNEPEEVSFDCLHNGYIGFEAAQRVRNMWPVDVQSSGEIRNDQLIRAYYLAQRLGFSEGYIPRDSKNIYLFSDEALTDELQDEISEVFHEERDGEEFLNSQAGIVIRNSAKG
jgi:hypothetical protein